MTQVYSFPSLDILSAVRFDPATIISVWVANYPHLLTYLIMHDLISDSTYLSTCPFNVPFVFLCESFQNFTIGNSEPFFKAFGHMIHTARTDRIFYFPTSIFSISSTLFPFVSGMITRVATAPKRFTAANMKKSVCIPKALEIGAKMANWPEHRSQA